MVFDDAIFASQLRGGISRYFAETIAEMQRLTDDGLDLIVPTFARSDAALEVGICRPFPVAQLAKRPAIAAINRVPEALRILRASGDYIVHHTFYRSSYLGRFRRAKARVVTVYDFIPERFPAADGSNPHFAKDDFVKAADAVICISEATRDDLLDRYGNLDVPVVAIPLGVSETFRPPTGMESTLFDFEYLFFVGQRDGYKAFDVALGALSRSAHRHLHLVATGLPATAEEIRMVADLGLTDRVHFVHLGDEQLVTAYQQAAAFIFPSAYEGFGIPTLEAMACGCPTITSDTKALIEVGGDTALTFAAGNVDDLTAQIDRLMSDASLRHRLRAAGIERAARYTWRATAEATLDLYAQVFARHDLVSPI